MTLEETYQDRLTSEVTKLYLRFCNKNRIEYGKLSQKQFTEDLVGLKVKVKNSSGVFKDKKWNRIDIIDIV